MNTKTTALQMPKSSSALGTLLWSGFAAGNLDAVAGVIAYYIYFELNPFQVLQFIASGIYGPSAIDGGTFMVVAGLLLHFLIAYVAAIIYFYAYPKISLLSKYKVPAGLVFGLGVWMVMNLLVLPNSNIPKIPFYTGFATWAIIWHMALVGLPIAILTGRYYTNRKQ